jgi:hypothetical protein
MAAHAGKIVMFGGSDGSGATIDETWEWDGTDWTRRTPATRPSPRGGAGMGAIGGVLVVFGGVGGGAAFGPPARGDSPIAVR